MPTTGKHTLNPSNQPTLTASTVRSSKVAPSEVSPVSSSVSQVSCLPLVGTTRSAT